MDKYIILGHENPDVDSIISGYLLQQLLIKKGKYAEFVIPDKKIEEDVIDICLSYNLNPILFQKDLPLGKYILVDHHKRNLPNDIVAIIDHHPTEEIINVSYYANEKASSTSCLIVQGNEEYFSKDEIELSCLAALVDTASFHSNKTRIKDKDWVMNCCSKYGLDYQKMYTIGLSLTNLKSIEKASLNDLKRFDIFDYHVQSSGIKIDKYDKNIISKILDMLKKYVLENNIDIFIFIIYNMSDFTSITYRIEKENIKMSEYEYLVSRANGLIPDLYKELKMKRS